MDCDSEDDVPLASLRDRPTNDNGEDNVPLAALQDRPTNDNVSNEGLYLMDTNDDPNLDPDYFPSCDIGSCSEPVYGICDNCNYVICKEHLTLASCDNGHNIVNNLPTSCTSNSNSDSQLKPINPREEQHNHCEIGECNKELYAACPRCYRFLCYDHLDNSLCVNDHQLEEIGTGVVNLKETPKTVQRPMKKSTPNPTVYFDPETYEVDGNSKEGASVIVAQKKRKTKINKKKIAKELRNKGEQYVSVASKKTVPARNVLRERCNGEVCKKYARKCSEISDEERQTILKDFYGTGSLQLQREYIVRYVKQIPTKTKTTNKEHSRRTNTFVYLLPKQGSNISVCKKFFLSTLCVSEKTVRTAMLKVKESGVLEKENRGGRSKTLKTHDTTVRNAIAHHINRFPRVESHYCRASTSKEYLHPDLSLLKMVEMFNRENEIKGNNIRTSYYTYSDVYRKMNLGFHNPKKDQCGLCSTYRSGDQNKKAELESRYQTHIAEKKAVREWKTHIKDHLVDEKCVCATFDLQQIILLPIAPDSKLFYHRRLTNFNLTIYDIASSECSCYVWHEGLGRRGSCEIASCLHNYLTELDNKNVEQVFLFSDGCCGQNKNSAIAAMLLHFVSTSKNVRFISLRFFEPYHGQNEGDSAHSAISSALGTVGKVCVPSELKSIIRLARRRQPYVVHSMDNSDFLDFMSLAKKLRILTVRKDDEGENVNWPSMVEYMVLKNEPYKIFFKTSHVVSLYSSLTVPRSEITPSSKPNRLYKKNEPKLKKEKYNDLMGLCSSPTPIVQGEDNVLFYKNLRHE